MTAMTSDQISALLDELADQKNELNNRIALVSLRLIGELIRAAHPTVSSVVLWNAEEDGLSFWSAHNSEGREVELAGEANEEVSVAAKRLDETNDGVWPAFGTGDRADRWSFQVNDLIAIVL
ncbi:hypothetical protein [Kitasatospora sp. MBT63]|uniref:hypothetical protein n=1 Tax=Kitasatospora sp. MBT63 TaxID=1444768 RepID=UPI00053A7B56|nr:hypothetical protein [Kitasatospora sp. MBT63]